MNPCSEPCPVEATAILQDTNSEIRLKASRRTRGSITHPWDNGDGELQVVYVGIVHCKAAPREE
eukprot:11358375-Alexandrium_andersonii.AAC.1